MISVPAERDLALELDDGDLANNLNEKDVLETEEPPCSTLDETKYICRVWCKCKIQNLKQSQMELRTKNKTWRQLIFRFKSSLTKARKHHHVLHMRLRLLKGFVLVWSVEMGSSKHVFIEMILEHLWWGNFVEGSIINGRRQSSNSVLL